ncbi:MAG: hypothetical protein ACR2HS_05060, partial [Gammaproteobacteria bacterium]
DFAEIYKTINAHYGKIDLMINNNHQLIYAITIPVQLKEIRPKFMDLPDIELQNIEILNNLLINKNKELMLDIAKQLIKESIDLNIIAKITKLTLQEINEKLIN